VICVDPEKRLPMVSVKGRDMARLKLAILCSCLAISSPALAKQCPSGQILRVSKGVCVAKASAIKDGVIASRDTKRSRAAAAVRSEDREDAKARTVVAKSAPQEAAGRGTTLSDAEAAPRPRSPYGELRLDYFGPRQ
jgi:hypothetical protein